MEDRQLIEDLLARQESDDLDFKSGQYNFDSTHGKSRFIKDIVAMANTPRKWLSAHTCGGSGAVWEGQRD